MERQSNKMKKGLVKTSLVIFFSLVLFTIIFLSLFSSARTVEKIYSLEEGIHINLGGEKTYTLKIITPSEEFVTKSSGDSIYYSPKETGIYKFFVYSEGHSDKYIFRIVETKEEATKINIEPPNNNLTIQQINENYSYQKLLNEGYKIKGEIEINKPVVWMRANGSLNEEKITSAPKISEQDKSELEKEVVVSSEEGLDYENVLSYTNLPKEVSDKNLIKIYWKEEDIYLDFEAKDIDGNGLLDYVEWIIPHLSEQTFEIIVITKAEHLNSDREFISDIYNEVKELDDVWSEAINDNEYIRVVFEKNLTNQNDITFYPRIISGNPIIEIYEKDSDEKIAEFNSIVSNDYNKALLTNLIGEQDTFDLKIIGGSLEFDYIIDPQTTYNMNPAHRAYWGQPTSSNRWQTGTNATQIQYINMGSENSTGTEASTSSIVQPCMFMKLLHYRYW